ncbi:hypothetical protein IU438_04785 [Nocardia cyriacigeorgica]|uniref:hypothetical protein n=1 Tax=Nocardia cyriacigeorgica TaxID=135487 RepID=UPI001894554D|nr:hypothetical protein [Nocardia cyriacigeorgica]MBF6161359.1 hypothetical protein [Nocardia cyriacigeorgica]MBF6200216.1 hypothetical protein [Nocardia cyriacigeorgica]MBF6395099.1 hypothetical protein [Nocardia cyriacigeorgica]MBF6400732.1 hypothetical protein [Nocardia cyriacigeorgica]
MARRTYKRDSRGRFARVSGVKVGHTVKAARRVASNTARTGARKVGNTYVSGSFEKHLEVGQGGDYKGVKLGAEFRTPSGRGAVTKAIVGYHGKPDRRLDVTPKLDKPNRELTVTVKPNPARKATARDAPPVASRRRAAGRRVRT